MPAASSGLSLVVGLGNPGPDYADTRHNAGVWFVQQLLAEQSQNGAKILKSESRFQSATGTLQTTAGPLLLLLPLTFMNHSGQAVGAFARYHHLSPASILVAHDDLDLAPGDIRLKFDGGHGGHNGLRDIIRHLGSNAFYRLRIGIGHPRHTEIQHQKNEKNVTDYVLHPPKKSERILIDTAIQKAHALLPDLLAGRFQQAMMKLHSE